MKPVLDHSFIAVLSTGCFIATILTVRIEITVWRFFITKKYFTADQKKIQILAIESFQGSNNKFQNIFSDPTNFSNSKIETLNEGMISVWSQP